MLDVHCECPGCGTRFPTTHLTQELLFSFLHTLAFLETDFADRSLVMTHIHTMKFDYLTARTSWFTGRKPTHVPFFLCRACDSSALAFVLQHVCSPQSA